MPAETPTLEVPRRVRHRGPLQPIELTEGAVLADLCVALCLIGWLLPIGTFLIAVAVIPMAALAARRRLRAVLVAAIAGVTASFLVIGTGLAVNVAGCAAVGAVVGVAIDRGWGRARTVVTATVGLGAPVAASAIAVLAVLSSLRRLVLVQLTNAWRGTAKILDRAHLGSVVAPGDDAVAWLVRHWALLIVVATFGAVGVTAWIAYGLAKPILARLAGVTRAPLTFPSEPGPAGPAPVRLVDATYRYPGRDTDALAGVNLAVDPGTFTVVVGRNGSGKSTLARVLAGLPLDTGTVNRPGAAALGHQRGTALVFQRPETQVLGVTVADDVVWGLRPGDHPDIEALLARVGLAGFERRETSTLSGGELQRLALAAALARNPALLVADEVTAMVDPPGRAALVDVLRDTAARGVAVVHITHRLEEAVGAAKVIRMAAGQVVAGDSQGPRPAAVERGAPVASETLIRLRGVGHEYSSRTPWAHRALAGIDLDLRRGEGVLVVGSNGSGKSTLAWILAGLLAPSEGEATIEGTPLIAAVGSVGLSIQHARLQLLRSTVASDIQAASGTDEAGAAAAMRKVGLDPAQFAERSVDQLSGGEQRRAALAGLLASEPRVLVLDEPFAGLDTESRDDLGAILAHLRADGLTLVIVSHDTDLVEGVVDRVVHLESGRIMSGRAVGGTSPAPRAPRRTRELNLLRVVPGTSVIHRLWAGTKVLCLLAVAATLSVRPTWPSAAAMAGIVAIGIGVARIPRGAVPRLPRWFWIAIGLSAVLAATAGGPPTVHIAGSAVGLGALADWARATCIATVVIAGAALLSWTTPVGEVAPALRRLGAPLRVMRVPVDEWAAGIGLSFRCLPLLLDEVRALGAVRRLRAPHAPRVERSRRGLHRLVNEQMSLLLAAIIVALRRAAELATAIEARGGLGVTSAARRGPKAADLAVLAAVGAAATTVLLR